MLIIGCDFHPGFQQVAVFDKRTGEYQEKHLSPSSGSGTVLPLAGGAGGAGRDGGVRASLPPRRSGEFVVAILGARTEEMDGEILCPPHD